jgi:hypothetical protein
MDKPLEIDHQRNIATVPLTDEPKVLLISEGRARLYELHEYGSFLVKMHDGKITKVDNTESDKF